MKMEMISIYFWKLFLTFLTISDVSTISSSIHNYFISPIVPYITTMNNTKITGQAGSTAVLPCFVQISSQATISWIRRRDFQLLTVGFSTHCADPRFSIKKTEYIGDWSLQIRSIVKEDSGIYECQLSVYPTQSIIVELSVIEAEAEIIGSPDIYVSEGSELYLECKLKYATENPLYVFWYHNDKMINYNYQDGFAVKTYTNDDSLNQLIKKIGPSKQMNASSSIITSVLTVKETYFHHSGNYTCVPSNSKPSSIFVHVLKDGKPSAMEHMNLSMTSGEVRTSYCWYNNPSSNLLVRLLKYLAIVLVYWNFCR